MEKYIGVKIVHAEPMSNHEYIKMQLGITGETGHNEPNKEGYKVVYEDGYVSWSPKEVFEKAYRRIDNLTFGLAIEALKQGKKVSRTGWNGKGMWLELSFPCEKGILFVDVSTIPDDVTIDKIAEEWKKYDNIIQTKVITPTLPFIVMKTVDNKYVPWLASQTDMLAEDWCIVGE